MASISRASNGHRLIQFMATTGKRRTVRLGKVSQRTAEEIRVRVEYLHTAAAANCPIDAETARWVGAISDALHNRLAKVGLIAPRSTNKSSSNALGPFLDAYIAERAHYKPNTKKTIDQARRLLIDQFGKNAPIDTITAGAAEDWQNVLRKRFKPATIATHIKRARQMFAYAVNAELVYKNPFAGLKVPQQVDKSREEFIDHETINRVLEAAPDSQWRCIIALERSETITL